MKAEAARNIDEYIALQPLSIREELEKLRSTIRSAAPKAEEVISYQMPAFKFHGMLVYFATYKNHIGFYPTGSGIAAFKKELVNYKTSKGTVQFPVDKPLPLSLISKIVKFRVKENVARQKEKELLKAKKKK
jgi:uncharacterized protein YdhG (YjbR/CyaY superfamily)